MLARAVLAGSLAVVVMACGGARRPAPPSERTVLVVNNQGYTDLTVYVIAGARRTRVGIAGGLKVTELTIPPHMLGNAASLSFVADPIGGTRQSFSQDIYVRTGDRITLIIPP